MTLFKPPYFYSRVAILDRWMPVRSLLLSPSLPQERTQ